MNITVCDSCRKEIMDQDLAVRGSVGLRLLRGDEPVSADPFPTSVCFCNTLCFHAWKAAFVIKPPPEKQKP